MLDLALLIVILFLTWRYIAVSQRNHALWRDVKAEREDAYFWMQVVAEMEETGGTSRLLSYRREGQQIVRQALKSDAL
jgi:hypothetical protein